MKNFDFKLWPNTNGKLGKIKVQIPDGIIDEWPEGDALEQNFVYKDGELSGFVDTKALIANESKSTTFPYDYVNIQVSKSLEETMTFNKGERTKYFTVTFGSDFAEEIFKYMNCKTVSDVQAIEPNYQTVDIVDGAWTESLADLEDGNRMFNYCGNLESFTSDLSNLTSGVGMFSYCYNLTTFSSDLSNLTDGHQMFYGTRFKSFTSDLSNLTIGYEMFYNCYNLTTFSSDLSNLTDGYYMFQNCKLDTASVQNIADTINTYNETIHIGIGNSTPNGVETEAFKKMVSKGWTVYVNGSQYTPSSGYYGYAANASLASSLTTLDELGETEMFNPKPYWAKPVQSDEEHARYIDAEGNFYNILGAQFIYGDNLSTYGMFLNEEDAAANMRLTKMGEEPIETA